MRACRCTETRSEGTILTYGSGNEGNLGVPRGRQGHFMEVIRRLLRREWGGRGATVEDLYVGVEATAGDESGSTMRRASMEQTSTNGSTTFAGRSRS